MNDIDRSADGVTGARLVPIPGSHNLRDMGGYRTSDGRTVRWRTLFRSGLMAQLTESDRQAFNRLGITSIYDLRARKERLRRPTEWHHGQNIAYHSREYEMSAGALDELIAKGALVREEFMQVIHEAYRELPFEQADSYRELFGLLTEGRVPLLFNCTAGKDRTGIVAALILHALGVPRAQIDHDYALTERAMPQLQAILFADPRYAPLAALPREQYLPMLRADPEYLNIAFAEMQRQHGSIDGYLSDALGVGPREIQALRANLLQEPAA